MPNSLEEILRGNRQRRYEIERPDYRPTASPVNTVAAETRLISRPMPVKPVEPLHPQPPTPLRPFVPRTDMQNLAKALAALNPVLNAFADGYFEAENKEQMTEAEIQFLRDNSPESWAEAVRRNPALADKSPVFRKAYEERIARNLVQSRAGQMIAEYYSSEIANSTDPNAITQWLTERFKGLLDSVESPYAKQAMVEEIQAVTARFYRDHQARARDNLIAQNLESASVNLRTTIDNLNASGAGIPFEYGEFPKTNLTPVQEAFLKAVAGPESGGRWNVRFNGFNSNGAPFVEGGDHPRVKVVIDRGPHAGKTSDAAGMFQILSSTWDRYMPPGTPFTRENQVIAASRIAEDAYKTKTGRNLWEDLEKNGLTPEILKVMSGTWEALGKHPPSRFIATYNRALRERGQEPKGAVSNPVVYEVAEQIRKVDLDLQRQGVRPDVINKHLTETVVQMAIERQDESILDAALLDRVGRNGERIPGPGMTLDGRKSIEEARVKIRKLKQQEQDQQRKLEEEQKKAAKAAISRAAIADGMKAFSEGRGFVIPPDIIAEANKHDPDFAKELLETQNKLNTYNSGTEDPVIRAQFEAKAARGELTESEILEAVRNNQLRDPVAIGRLYETVGRIRRADPLSVPGIREIVNQVEFIVGQPDPLLKMLKRGPEGSAAVLFVTEAVVAAKEANPNIAPSELRRIAQEAADEAIRLYASPSDYKAYIDNKPENRRASPVSEVTTPMPSLGNTGASNEKKTEEDAKDRRAEAAPSLITSQPPRPLKPGETLFADVETLQKYIRLWVDGDPQARILNEWLAKNNIKGEDEADAFFRLQADLLRIRTGQSNKRK